MKEDLGIKIGSKEQKAWEDMKEKAKEEIIINNRINLINEEIIKLAEKKIKEEIENFK